MQKVVKQLLQGFLGSLFCFDFQELSHLTRDLSQARKKIHFVTS